MTAPTKKKILRIVCFTLAGILLLTVAAVGTIYGYYHSKVALIQRDDGRTEEAESISDEETEEDDLEMEEAAENLEEKEPVPSKQEVSEDEGVFNLLLIGTDERSMEFSQNARGDSCILLSIDKNTMVTHLVSFERGMGVPILEGQYEGQWDWLTHSFRYGGADLMMREIEECFKVDVDRYVRVNFNTFVQLVDAVGGVDIELTEMEAAALNGQVRTNAIANSTVHAGENHLDGYDALQYSRLRYIDSDWRRIERQRNVIEKVITKAKGLKLSQLDAMLNTVLPLVQTNLTEGELASLAVSLVPKFSRITVEQMTIPIKGTYGSMKGMGGRTLFAVDFETNAKALQDALYVKNGPTDQTGRVPQ